LIFLEKSGDVKKIILIEIDNLHMPMHKIINLLKLVYKFDLKSLINIKLLYISINKIYNL